MNEVLLLETSFANREEALKLGRQLIEEKLVACAQVGTSPVVSIYSWKGKIEEEEEYLLSLKSLPEIADKLQARLAELHSYETPQILSKVYKVETSYAAWVKLVLAG